MTDGGAGRRTAWLVAFVAAGVLAAGAIANRGLLSGAATPFYRDLGTTQRPARALWSTLGPSSLNPAASFGQAYWGNPNFVLAYPFPRAPRWLGIHLLSHVALGGAGAFVLGRALGLSAAGALVTSLSWSLSGYVLSSTAFLNATTTLAWGPWLLAAVAASRRAAGRRLVLVALGATAAAALLFLAGEPALAAFFFLAAAAFPASWPRGERGRAAGVLSGAVIAATLLILPWLLEAGRASEFSSRRMRGFSWEEFSAVFLHPARLLETPFPGLFGDPAKLAGGAFWGFGVTQGNPPYLASLSFGLLPLVLALLLAVSARRNEGRFFLALGLGGLLVALYPLWPFAREVYGALTPLHVVRYPLKALVLTFLSVSVLAGIATDRLILADALPRYRRTASRVCLVLAALFAAGAVWARSDPAAVTALLARGWSASWALRPEPVLAPIVKGLPGRAALDAAVFVLLALLLRRDGDPRRGATLLLPAVALELLLSAGNPVPSVPATWYASPSPFVARARAIPGRVFERTGKDVDTVRRGVFGKVFADDVASIGLAQVRQGWALTGAPWGLRYAFDADPDGSYTILNRIAADVVLSRDPAPQLKWLRAGGVGAVIAHDMPSGLAGLEAVVTEDAAGIPATLWRVTDPLPGVRRASRVFGASSVNEAVSRFESPGFDPATDVVVAGRPPEATSGAVVDTGSATRVLRDGPDALTVETSGTIPAVLHVDRSFTPRVSARVNGHAVVPLAANVNLIGIPVPAGKALVEIDLAP